MNKIRDLAITLLSATLIFCILDGYLRWSPRVDNLLDNTTGTMVQLRLASISFKESSERTSRATKDWESFFNAPATRKSISEGLFFLRSGPRLERGLIATTNLINEIRDTNHYVNEALLPSIALAAGRAVHALAETAGASTLAITALRAQIENPNIQMLLFNLATLAASSTELVETSNLTLRDIEIGVPQMVSLFQDMAKNLNNGTYELSRFLKESATFIASFNAPLTPFQKVMKYLLQSIAVSLPVLIRR